jgi:NDP-sugar pyrophosphorylase family protein
MILAAGLGTRLRPLTNTIPKPLLLIAGRPLIIWNLLLLRQHGITEVIINLHHLGHLIEKELGNGSALGVRICYSREPVLLGTGGGIKQAEPFFEGQPFLVLNGDTLLDVDLKALIRFHTERAPLATMVVREDPDADRWGPVELNDHQQVVTINGRGRANRTTAGEKSKRMFAGVHLMHPRLLRDVPSGQESSIIEAYVREMERGEPVYGFHMTGYWSDIGTVQRYAQAQRDADTGLINLAVRGL